MQTAEGNYVLRAVRSDSGEPRSYRVERMQGAEVTAQAFTPRYEIEITPGPLPVTPAAPSPRIERSLLHRRPAARGLRLPAAPRRQGPIYVYRCTVCRKTFERRTMDSSLNPHKHARGYPCPGRVGVSVRTGY
jgi:hypothetical protein